MDNGTSGTIVVLTYDFPPAAGSGVQRIAKLCKFLPRHGIEPLVICSEPVPGDPVDPTLEAEVGQVEVMRLRPRNPSWRISRMIQPLKALRAGASPPHVGGVAAAPATPGVPLSIRLARLISDDDASFWARNAARVAVREGTRVGATAVLASGPPFSVLTAGARAAETLGVPFLADMRDGWLTNPGIVSSPRRLARARVQQRWIMREADAVTCVSGPIAAEAQAAGARRVEVIPNGFDADDMPAWTPTASGTLHVAFMGRFYGLTDPEPFLRGMAEAAKDAGPALDMRLEVAGPYSQRFDSLVRSMGLGNRVVTHGQLSHDEALAVVARADVGLVAIADVPGADAVYTGKLFEYLGMGLPVLVVGPTAGAAARLVRETRAGWTVDPADVVSLVQLLSGLAEAKRVRGVVETEPDSDAISVFERSAQAGRFASILGEIRSTR